MAPPGGQIVKHKSLLFTWALPEVQVVILEQTGKNSGYRDVRGFCPIDHCCVEGGPEKLDSVVDMRAISEHFKEAGMDVVHSRDAGRYLCYCSLYHGQRRAAFIHIPSSGSLASAERLVPFLREIIVMMLDQVEGLHYHSET